MTACATTSMRRLGQTAVQLPALGFGGAGLMYGGAARSAAAATASSSDGRRSSNGFRLPTDQEAAATVDRVWEHGVRYFDTAPWYGRGQSEHRLGRALYDGEQRPRDEFVLPTKVGRVLTRPRGSPPRSVRRSGAFGALCGWEQMDAGLGLPPDAAASLHFDHYHDYSYDGIMRSYEDSLQRLGMNRVDALGAPALKG